MKYFKRFLKILCVILAVVLVETTSRFIFVPYGYSRTIDRDRQSKADRVGTLYLGASHSLSLVEQTLNENAGEHDQAYILAGGAMQMDVLYYHLQDALSQFDVKAVYLDVSPGMFASRADVDDLYPISSINRLHNPALQLRAVVRCLEPESWEHFVFFSKYCLSINQTPDDVPQNIRDKVQNLLGTGTRTVKTLDAHKNGFDYDKQLEKYRKHKVSFVLADEKVQFFRKIIELCLARGIDLTLYTVIGPAAAVYGYENYDETHTFFCRIAEEYGLSYYDFNYYIGRADLFDEYVHFYDSSHLSEQGGILFTRLLADWIRDGKPDCFYKSAQEVLDTYDFP